MEFFRKHSERQIELTMQRLASELEMSHDITSTGDIPGFLVEFHPYPPGV